MGRSQRIQPVVNHSTLTFSDAVDLARVNNDSANGILFTGSGCYDLNINGESFIALA